MAEKTYFDQRNIDNTRKLREIRRDLPPLCNEFFVGIETRTSVLTRLAYAYDLRIFFYYLFTETTRFACYDANSFDFDALCKVSTSDIELFMEYLSYYKFDGKEYVNTEKTKARKLASIKSFFKYFYNKDKIPADPASKVLTPKIHDKPIIRLDGNEVSMLLDEVESGANLPSPRQEAFHEKTKKRDLAIITLFLGTGIRSSELVGLDVSDLDFSINGFKVTRKGANHSILYFSQ